MRLLIKQRVFSWTDTYDIYDESGQVKYTVKADLLTIGHRLRVFDATGEQIGIIKEKVLTFLPAFEVEVNGRKIGEIQQKFSFFKPKYEINYNGWRVEGDFLGWNYDVYQECCSIIHISKELLHWGDTYVLDIINPRDELDGLMLVIAIDAANCTQRKG